MSDRQAVSARVARDFKIRNFINTIISGALLKSEAKKNH